MYIKVNSSTLRAKEVILILLLNNFSSKFIYILVYTDIVDPLSHGRLALSSNNKHYTEI